MQIEELLSGASEEIGHGGERPRRTATRTGAALGVVARAAVGVGRLDARARDRVGAAVGAVARRAVPAQHRAPVHAVVVRARRANRCRVVPGRESRGLRGAAEGNGPVSGLRALPGFAGGHPDHPPCRRAQFPIEWTSAGRIVFRSDQAPAGLWSVSPVGGEPEPLAGDRDAAVSSIGFGLPGWHGSGLAVPSATMGCSAFGSARRPARRRSRMSRPRLHPEPSSTVPRCSSRRTASRSS